MIVKSNISVRLAQNFTQTCSDKSFEIGGSHLPVGDVTDTVSIFYIKSVNLCLTDIRKGVDQPHRGPDARPQKYGRNDS